MFDKKEERMFYLEFNVRIFKRNVTFLLVKYVDYFGNITKVKAYLEHIKGEMFIQTKPTIFFHFFS